MTLKDITNIQSEVAKPDDSLENINGKIKTVCSRYCVYISQIDRTFNIQDIYNYRILRSLCRK